MCQTPMYILIFIKYIKKCRELIIPGTSYVSATIPMASHNRRLLIYQIKPIKQLKKNLVEKEV
jgi:hypothetical protein